MAYELLVHVVHFLSPCPQASPGVVSCLEGQLHGLETGNQVEVREVVGMGALNGKTFTVKGMLSCDTKSTKIIIIIIRFGIDIIYSTIASSPGPPSACSINARSLCSTGIQRSSRAIIAGARRESQETRLFIDYIYDACGCIHVQMKSKHNTENSMHSKNKQTHIFSSLHSHECTWCLHCV